MSPSTASLEQNIRLYPLYQMASNFLPWLPLFFLFFNQYVSLSDALVIASTYYFSVFLLEIPSGYLSDLWGRKPVLIASSLFATISYSVFLFATNLPALMLGQCLLAGFFAFKSGSDTSLLYDSLTQLDRQNEYAELEAKSAKYSMLSLAASGLIGGALGLYSLHMAYVLSLIASLVSLVLCTRFYEPKQVAKAQTFIAQLLICVGNLKKPLLLWIFGYFVVAYSLEHIPAEFNQPYVKLLQNDWFGESDTSSMVSGFVVSASMLAGAYAVSISIPLQRVLGLHKLLLLSVFIQTVIIAAMSLLLHPVILLVVMLRNSAMALTHAPMLSAIAPHIASAQRATYLSIQSLAGRLGFAIALYSLSNLTSADNENGLDMMWPQLSLLLRTCLLIAAIALAILYLTSRYLSTKTTRQ